MKPAVAATMCTFSTKISVAPAIFLSLIDSVNTDAPHVQVMFASQHHANITIFSLIMASKM